MLDLEIVAKEPAQLRLEATGTLGVSLASFVLNGDEVRYILTRQRRFVTAPAAKGSLRELVPLSLSPRTFMRLLFDRSLPESDWKCENGADGKPVVCANRDDALTVRWEERGQHNRRMKIESSAAEVQMVIDEAKSKVELKPEVFKLNAPPGFHHETVTAESAP